MNTDLSKLGGLPIYQLIIIVVVLFTQGIWLFMDAQKNGANKWFWGIWGLLSSPSPLIIYLFVVRKIYKRNSPSASIGSRIKSMSVPLIIIVFTILLILGILLFDHL